MNKRLEKKEKNKRKKKTRMGLVQVFHKVKVWLKQLFSLITDMFYLDAKLIYTVTFPPSKGRSLKSEKKPVMCNDHEDAHILSLFRQVF